MPRYLTLVFALLLTLASAAAAAPVGRVPHGAVDFASDNGIVELKTRAVADARTRIAGSWRSALVHDHGDEHVRAACQPHHHCGPAAE